MDSASPARAAWLPPRAAARDPAGSSRKGRAVVPWAPEENAPGGSRPAFNGTERKSRSRAGRSGRIEPGTAGLGLAGGQPLLDGGQARLEAVQADLLGPAEAVQGRADGRQLALQAL